MTLQFPNDQYPWLNKKMNPDSDSSEVEEDNIFGISEIEEATSTSRSRASVPMLTDKRSVKINVNYSRHRERETMPRRKLVRLLKIACGVSLVALLFIAIAALTTGRRMTDVLHLSFKPEDDDASNELKLGHVAYDQNSNMLTFTDTGLAQDTEYLRIKLPYTFQRGQVHPASACRQLFGDLESDKAEPFAGEKLKELPQMCLHFNRDVNLAVYEVNVEGQDCHLLHWFSEFQNVSIEQCIDMNMNDDKWYGGGGLSIHRWPLNRANVSIQPYITWHFDSRLSHESAAHFNAFIEPYFVSAQGTAIILYDDLPLFMSINYKNSQSMCFKSAFNSPYHPHNPSDPVLLKYLVCRDRSAKSIHRHLLDSKLLTHPLKPPMTFLEKPLWSTRGIFPSILQKDVISYVTKIKDSKLPYSQLFIDGNYSDSPGNFYFSHKTFPHATQFIWELESDGDAEKKLPVGIEVQPEINPAKKDALQYSVSAANSTAQKGTILVDVFNLDAVKWFKQELSSIQATEHVSGYRFSGGEASNFVKSLHGNLFDVPKQMKSLNHFTQKYATLASAFQQTSVIGSGFKSQEFGFVVDAGPMLSTWDHRKGLKSIIPTVLTYGLMGYPFVMAGPIGGITGKINSTSAYYATPDRELYIRWLQIATFLPVMEFSIGPWAYDEEVVNYTRQQMQYRHLNLWPHHMSAAVAEAVQTGTPIIRPLWWFAENDKMAQFIDCEFLVSNTLLVAPVLNKGDRQRDIYLPHGSWWLDLLHGKYYKGGQWIQGFSVKLFEIATFIQKSPPKSHRNEKAGQGS